LGDYFVSDFFANNWVVSIVTGLLVYAVTKFWEGFKEKKRYYNTLRTANDEVFNTIKVMIPEEKLPSSKILFSLHRATAKKYGIKQEDMDELPLIIDGLIKEILDSSFLSYQDKVIYSERLHKTSEETKTKSEKYDEIKSELLNNKKDGLFSSISLFFAMLATLASFIVSYFDEKDVIKLNKEMLIKGFESSATFITIVILIITLLISLYVLLSVLKEEVIDNVKNVFNRKRKKK
jgi:hypothetical protein